MSENKVDPCFLAWVYLLEKLEKEEKKKEVNEQDKLNSEEKL